MKAYVQYFDEGCEAIASDGYRPLDARLSLINMIILAEMPNFQGYTDFEIRRGDFKNYKVIYRRKK